MFSAGVVAYFVAKMGAALRVHEHELAAARERALEANQLAVLGTLAAGTAHELGTPLGTTAIAAKEMEREHRSEAVLTARIGSCASRSIAARASSLTWRRAPVRRRPMPAGGCGWTVTWKT